MKPSEKLRSIGLALPEAAAPVGSYVPAKRSGPHVLTSGQIPVSGGKPAFLGKVGGDVSLEDGAKAAKVCVLNALAAVGAVCGGIDEIKSIVRVCVFVAGTEGFTDQPKVANGASDLLLELFGEAGRHVRSAVGVAELPLGVPVELELVVEA